MAATADTTRMKTEIFQACAVAFERCKANEFVDFKSLCKVLWNTFDNSASLVDVSSLFTMIVSKNVHHMTLETFAEFINGYGRIKYPKSEDFAERVLVDIRRSKLPKLTSADNDNFGKIFDRNTTKVLLMYDQPLKSVFTSFIGKKEARMKELMDKQKELDTKHSANTHVGAFASGLVVVENDTINKEVITWADAKAKNLGLQMEEFTMFACAFDLIPKYLTVEQMLNFVKKTLDHFPLKASTVKQTRNDEEIRPSSPEKKATPNTSLILFPHFQLLICFLAVNQDNMMEMTKAGLTGRQIELSKGLRPDAIDRKYGYEIVGEFFREIGIGRVDTDDSTLNDKMLEIMGELIPDEARERKERPEDKFRSVNDLRQEKLMNVNFILDDAERLAIDSIVNNSSSDSSSSSSNELGSAVLQDFLNLIYCKDESSESETSKRQHKPVVICDPVPVPKVVPDVIEQLIQGALAHHNLGNGDEAIKFLEAARLHLESLEKSGSPEKAANPARKRNAFDLKCYITVCKGNVSQTCNDDEFALRYYIEGYNLSVDFEGMNGQWAHLFMNSIGMIAYYTFRFQCAALCFKAVSIMRLARNNEQISEGEGDGLIESTALATINNNEACAFFLMDLKGEARKGFEKSWEIFCNVLGHQSPRTVTVWKNLEKARRVSGGGALLSKLPSSSSVAAAPPTTSNYTTNNNSNAKGGGGANTRK